MNQRAQIILKWLESLFPSPKIPLLHKDPYTLLIAVLLSAQSTDQRVNEVTPELFQLADTPEKMEKLPVHVIEDRIRKVGLGPKKARAIHQLSKDLLKSHKGQVPKSLEELEALPGVGHKTASVVLIQAFQIPAFPVDTHIHRLAKRWGLSSGKNVVQTEKDLKKIFPKTLWIKLHLQIIYYARAYCKAKGHDIKNCPICNELSSLPFEP
ncbi:MAG: endonuclease III [Simkaniaceae bacterium]